MRESRKLVIHELVNLEEVIDFVFNVNLIEGKGSMGARATEEDKHGEEMYASAKENGDVQPFERIPKEE